jgi:hypothetical protein
MQQATPQTDAVPALSRHAHPPNGPTLEATKDLIRRLLLERIAWRAIARVAGVSRSRLQKFVNQPSVSSTTGGTVARHPARERIIAAGPQSAISVRPRILPASRNVSIGLSFLPPRSPTTA